MLFGLQTKNEAYITAVWTALRLSPKELKEGIETLERLYEETTGQTSWFKNDHVLNKSPYGQKLIFYRDVTAFHKELKDNGWEKKADK